MAECAAASPGHSFDFIPSYLPAARSPQADILATSKTSGISGSCISAHSTKDSPKPNTSNTGNTVTVNSQEVLIFMPATFLDLEIILI
jgi:hypothetical protein